MNELGIKRIKLKSDGKSHNEISNLLKCSKSTVSKHCKIITNVINLRENNNTYDNIKKKCGISYDLVKKICSITDIVYNGKFLKRYSKSDIEKMQKFYNLGNTLKQTKKEFKCSVSTLLKHLNTRKKNKIPEDEFKKSKSNAVILWRINKKIDLVKYKGGCCCVCGYDKSIKSLTFHHLYPNEKDFNISGKSYSFVKLKKEVDKCICVCSNCHIEIHEEITNYGYSKIVNKLNLIELP